MKCVHKNDGENKIETNLEVYCAEKLLIKSDNARCDVGRTWCGMLLGGHSASNVQDVVWHVTGWLLSKQRAGRRVACYWVATQQVTCRT
jgi:hypothetical protein